MENQGAHRSPSVAQARSKANKCIYIEIFFSSFPGNSVLGIIDLNFRFCVFRSKISVTRVTNTHAILDNAHYFLEQKNLSRVYFTSLSPVAGKGEAEAKFTKR